MNKFARLLALLLTVMLCVTSSVAAFAEAETTTDATTETTTETTTEVTTSPTDVMATVNGVDITRATVESIRSNLISTYSQYGYDTTDASFLQVMNQYAVEYAVQLEVMNQKAIALGYDQFTEEEKAEIEAENATQWEEVVSTYVSYYGGVTSESTDEEKAAARVNILAMLESYGYTEAAMLQSTYENKKYDRVEAHMIEGATVTAEEVKALFDSYVAQDEASYKDNVSMYEYMTQYYGQTAYYVPEGYRGVTHILLKVDETLLSNYTTLSAKLEEQQEAETNPEAVATAEAEATAEPTVDPNAEPTATPEPAVTQAEVDAAYQAILDSVQPTIDEINQKLAEGVAFADLVAEYGTDPGMQSEPNKSQGYSVHKDSIIWDPVFVQAAFSVDNVGDIAAPVVGSYGVHIVQYTRDVPAGAVEYTADIESALTETALSEKENELFNSTMETWLAEAEVVYSAEARALIDAANASTTAE